MNCLNDFNKIQEEKKKKYKEFNNKYKNGTLSQYKSQEIKYIKKSRKQHNYIKCSILDTLISVIGNIDNFNNIVDYKKSIGLTHDEALRELFQDYPLRTDKKIIALDLETANPPEEYLGFFDRGPYSEIIELGYIIYEKDKVPIKKHFMFGIDGNFLDVFGTGAEHIHNIKPSQVKNLVRFVDDKYIKNELLKDLNNSILLAHNANFEVEQLLANLEGFNEILDSLEIIDTMYVCKHFINNSKSGNSNKNFVEKTGGKYINPHRALNDSIMSLNALLRLKGLPEIN